LRRSQPVWKHRLDECWYRAHQKRVVRLLDPTGKLTRSQLSEGYRGDFAGCVAARKHHRHATGHQRGLSGSSSGFYQKD
jgi:hypothetical protein